MTSVRIFGFHGLTDMPAEFKNAMDYTLTGLKNNFCFHYDILFVSKGSGEDHSKLVTEKSVLKNLMQINFVYIYQRATSLNQRFHG